MAAGHDYHCVKFDPAIERWQAMHNTMYQRFRWTPKNTPALLVFAFAVPGLAFWSFSQTNYRWNYKGKTKDESIVNAPASKEA